MKRIVYILFVLFLLSDIVFSFIQHFHVSLDGDMASIIMPSKAYQAVLDDPFGMNVLFNDSVYPATNRFFAHWFMSGYFKTVPVLLQHITNPIDSIYLSCAIAKTGIQFLIIFLLAYLLFNFKMSQHGAYTWAMRGFSFSGWGLTGAPGPFRNSGEYAIQMLIFGSLAVAYVYALKDYWGRYKKWFFYVAAATGYMAVMGASSRGSQLGLVAIGIWFTLKHKQGFKGLILIIIVGVALFLILPDRQLDRFREMGSDVDSLQRLAYWQYALSEVIPNNLILGVGYSNWLEYVSFKVPEGLGPYMIVQESHNIFIQATSELGIVGLFSFLLLILYAFIVNARTRKMAKYLNNKLLYSLPYGLDAGLIGYLVAGSFFTVLYYPFFWIQITMIVMLNNVCNLEYKKHDD